MRQREYIGYFPFQVSRIKGICNVFLYLLSFSLCYIQSPINQQTLRRKLTEQHLFHRLFSHVFTLFSSREGCFVNFYFFLSFSLVTFSKKRLSLKPCLSLSLSRRHHQSPRVLLSTIVKGNCVTGEIRIKVTGRFLDNDGPHNRQTIAN